MTLPSIDSQYVMLRETETHITIELDHPEKRNAVNPEMADGLYEVFSQLHAAPSKGLLLTGAGPVTCAGVDTDVATTEDYFEEYPNYNKKIHDILQFIRRYPRVTVFAGKGAAMGAGFSFALYSDFVVLGEETKFSYPEIKYGLSSPRPPQLVAQMVGLRLAKEIVLTGELISPEKAKNIGLVNDVVPEDEVEDRARARLENLAQYDTDVIAQVKDDLRWEPPTL
jgi:enoyl-CoA hydratase/carnithine racemase